MTLYFGVGVHDGQGCGVGMRWITRESAPSCDKKGCRVNAEWPEKERPGLGWNARRTARFKAVLGSDTPRPTRGARLRLVDSAPPAHPPRDGLHRLFPPAIPLLPSARLASPPPHPPFTAVPARPAGPLSLPSLTRYLFLSGPDSPAAADVTRHGLPPHHIRALPQPQRALGRIATVPLPHRASPHTARTAPPTPASCSPLDSPSTSPHAFPLALQWLPHVPHDPRLSSIHAPRLAIPALVQL